MPPWRAILPLLLLFFQHPEAKNPERCPCAPGKTCALQGNFYPRRKIRYEKSAIPGNPNQVLHVQLALKVKEFPTYSFIAFPNETSIDATWLPSRFDTSIADRIPPKIANVSKFIDAVRIHFELPKDIKDVGMALYLLGIWGGCSGNTKDMFKGQCQLDVSTASLQRFCLPGRPCTHYENSHQLVLRRVTTAKVGVLLCLIFDKKDPWEVNETDIDIAYEKCLGNGQYSTVFTGYLSEKCRLKEKQPLLTETRKIADQDALSRSRFLAEIGLRKTIKRHSNVVNLIGVNTAPESLCILLEYCEHGSLFNFLQTKLKAYVEVHEVEQISKNGPPPAPLNSNDFLKLDHCFRVAIDICNGLEHLHSLGIIHRSLQSQNILLAADYSAKISGLASAQKEAEPSNRFRTHAHLPIKYMAPESLRNSQYTTSSDIWMFGVLFWEILTVGGLPYPSVPVIQMYTVLRKAIRPPQPLSCSDPLYSLLQDCWSFEPTLRPKLAEIRRLLLGYISSGEVHEELVTIDPCSDSYVQREEPR
ncbi:unnamed protein product, partial [Mesorhabditis spiculigera]